VLVKDSSEAPSPPLVSLDDCIRGRRSIRRYDGRDVPDDVMRGILDLARHAPSSMDGQPCCFVLVRDRRRKERLAALKDAYCPPEKSAFPAGFLAQAPVVVVVCADRRRANARERENGILATAFLLLAAQARGLGGVFLSAYQPRDGGLAAEVGQLLGLPADIEPVTLVPLGYPAESPRPKALRDLDSLIHRETFAAAGPP